jgi:AcrR family transcriptional regulator
MPANPRPSSRASRGRRARANPDQLRSRILDAFSTRARKHGLRALLMTDLAAELRVSATTLYKLYPSKEALALACVERWADDLGAAEAAKRPPAKHKDGFEQYMVWIDAWVDANADLSPAFARDLQTDYPSVWQRYRDIVETRKRHGASLLRPLLKPGLDERVAFALLNTIFSTVLEPEFADRLHISRRDALRSAVQIWAGGALARKGQVRTLRAPRR